MDNLNKISKEIFRKTLFINNENTFNNENNFKFIAQIITLLHNCIFK